VTCASAPFPVSKYVRSSDLIFSNSSLLKSWGCIPTISIKCLARVVRTVSCLQYPLWSTGSKGFKLDSRINASNIWNVTQKYFTISVILDFWKKSMPKIYLRSSLHVFRNVAKIVDRSNCRRTWGVTWQSKSDHNFVLLAVFTCTKKENIIRRIQYTYLRERYKNLKNPDHYQS
jgi:hypothetical protein